VLALPFKPGFAQLERESEHQEQLVLGVAGTVWVRFISIALSPPSGRWPPEDQAAFVDLYDDDWQVVLLTRSSW
jgi:hypothetical protein